MSGRTRPGDWVCYECNENNFARRDNCFGCKAPRGGGGGGYKSSRYDRGYDRRGPPSYRSRSRSPPSRYRNGGYNSRRGGGSRGYDDGYGKGGGRGGDWRDGDWECYGCGFQNFAKRSECFKCNKVKGGRGGRNNDIRDGDWQCPKEDCGVNNFARRTECFKCGEPK